MPEVHPFALLKQREVDACVASTQETLHAWKQGWCPAAAFELECFPACDTNMEPDGGHWSAHGATPDAALWQWRSQGFDKQIERTIFNLDHISRNQDRHASSDIAEHIAREASNDLSSSLLRRLSSSAAILQADAGSPPAWLFRRSAGAAWLKVSTGGKSLGILIPNALLPGRTRPAAPAAREPVVPLAQALTGTTAHLRAELGQVQMSLGQLTSLEIGDVITLPIGIDQPLRIFAGKRRLVGQAYLGKQDGHRAVEMLAADKE
ncbi:MAG: FliM/FliN family flagellar motor switch protein [Burkholderiaceae bacterium]|nr:FliM/FliN family flagellar motor switch protein [Burkholderiaceae bacterium]